MAQRIRVVRELEKSHLTGTPSRLDAFMSRTETFRQVAPETLRVDAAPAEAFHHHVREVECDRGHVISMLKPSYAGATFSGSRSNNSW